MRSREGLLRLSSALTCNVDVPLVLQNDELSNSRSAHALSSGPLSRLSAWTCLGKAPCMPLAPPSQDSGQAGRMVIPGPCHGLTQAVVRGNSQDHSCIRSLPQKGCPQPHCHQQGCLVLLGFFPHNARYLKLCCVGCLQLVACCLLRRFSVFSQEILYKKATEAMASSWPPLTSHCYAFVPATTWYRPSSLPLRAFVHAGSSMCAPPGIHSTHSYARAVIHSQGPQRLSLSTEVYLLFAGGTRLGLAMSQKVWLLGW